MMLTKRQEEILNRIVEDYIDLAVPISSEFLEKKHKFGISPATIRIEMQKLTDAGYLFQPHTSAGRVPTDKSYRFFVNNLLERGVSEFKNVSKIEEIIREETRDVFKFISRLSKFLAETSSNLATIHLLEKDLFFKEGWEEILEEPEFEEKDLVFDFLELLEDFEENIKDFKINSGIRIFIGRENPFKRAKDFSIISSKCCFLDAGEGIVSLLGPKRMAYQKNIALIDSLIKTLKTFSKY